MSLDKMTPKQLQAHMYYMVAQSVMGQGRTLIDIANTLNGMADTLSDAIAKEPKPGCPRNPCHMDANGYCASCDFQRAYT